MKKKRFNILGLILIVFIISAGISFVKNTDFKRLIEGYKKTVSKGDINADTISNNLQKTVESVKENISSGADGDIKQPQTKDKDNSKSDNGAENSDNMLILVNKEHTLAPDYEPDDLVKLNLPVSGGITSEEKMMRKEAAGALKKMFNDAKKAGYTFSIVSGYRSYKAQKDTYDLNLKQRGKSYVEKYVAIPGQSEHQSGLAMDVGVIRDKSVEFGQTKESVWLRNNCKNYGFIIRYPAGKEDITGYNYEPWHVRYVGVKAAKDIKKNSMVLEEYLKESK